MKRVFMRGSAWLLALMIAAGGLTKRVYAQKQDEECILNILVTTCEEEGSVPLSNIILDIYRTNLNTSRDITNIDLKELQRQADLAATVITDPSGQAAYNLSKSNEREGVYLITPQKNPSASGEPVLLEINKNTKITLNLMPEKAPDIRMDILSLGQKSGSEDAGALHTWIIRSAVPAGICTAQQYRITDVLDHRLDYQKGSPRVSLYNRDGQEIILKDNHYQLTEEVQTCNKITVDAFSVMLLPEGMSFVSANLGKGDQIPEIRVRFYAAINGNSAMGATIPNDAQLDYTNSAGLHYHADSDIPEVHTGGILICKTNEEGTALAGSEFMLAREATQAEMEDETVTKEVLHIANKNLAVVFVDFYAEPQQKEKVYTAATNREGKAYLLGLACGSYYLIETKAPDGYDMVNQPMAVEITQTSHLEENAIQVINSRFRFPATGGAGSVSITAAGFLMICAACLLLLGNYRRRY